MIYKFRYLALILLSFFIFSLVPAGSVLAQAEASLVDVSYKGISEIVASVVHGDSKVWLLSNLISYFIDQGVPLDVIFLLLSVPFIAFIIAFFRQVVGVSTFGVYTPLLLALSFLLLGILFGIAVLLLVLVFSYLLRITVGKAHLLYIPRTAFVLSMISLSFLFIIWFGLQFGTPISISLAIFPMLMMSTIAEKFFGAQSEEGLVGAVRGTIQTVIIAIIAYYILVWPWLTNHIIARPEIVLLPLIGTALLGRFSGLKLIEYFRFRTLFKENIEE